MLSKFDFGPDFTEQRTLDKINSSELLETMNLIATPDTKFLENSHTKSEMSEALKNINSGLNKDDQISSLKESLSQMEAKSKELCRNILTLRAIKSKVHEHFSSKTITESEL